VIDKLPLLTQQKELTRVIDSSWTEESFLAELSAQRGVREAEVVRQLLNWLKPQMTRIWFGAGKRGSIVPVFKHLGVEHFLFALWTTGTVEIYFQWHKHKPPFDSEEKRLELLNKLNQIDGVDISPDRISARPSIPLSLLVDKKEYQKFVDIYKWFIEEVKSVKP
jgi:hypothetical protein